MKWIKSNITDGIFALGSVLAAFLLNLLLVALFETEGMIESIFVLAVFLTSWQTTGFFWGIAASLISVLVVNYTFTYPYWAFDLVTPECIAAAVVMLVVAVMTSTLTTQLKQQEKSKAEAEKERMRGNLLRAVSHDLRTPLTSIYGACSVLLNGYDDIPRQKQLRMLLDIQSDAQGLVRMVENLLSITRIDANKVSLNKQDTVLDELIDAVVVKFRKHYPHQEILLDLPASFVSLPMDPMLIEQVLINLLENALFHAKGMEHLWLRILVKGHKAVFYVEDDGCGIPPEKLAKIFTGNVGQTNAADTSRSSMGIGLSVCCTIIKAHGGELRAANRPGGGSQFYFSLGMENHNGKQ